MIVQHKCNLCGAHSDTRYICDTCTKDLSDTYHGLPLTLEGGYGSSIDGSTYHFCNYKCLIKFVIAELNKENIIKRDITTGEKNDKENE